MQFPAYLELGSLRVHPHFLFESLAYVTGFQAYRFLRDLWGDAHATYHRWWLIAAAAAGAALGSKVLFWIVDPVHVWAARDDPGVVLGGKTILGGLIGGWLAVEFAKKRLGIRTSTGDLYAIPLCVGIVVGRIGCFFTGLADETHGLPTTLAWGIDFGDGIPRHPTQLYEIAFLFLLGVALVGARRMALAPGDLFRLFMVGYFGFRLLVEFLKPGLPWAGLTTLQWACVAVLAFYGASAVRHRLPVEVIRAA